MQIQKILVTGRFKKEYRRLPKAVQGAAKVKELIFRNNPFDPRLEIHKLHGKEKEIWSFSITRAYRIKFIFLNKMTVLFLDIGGHEIYQ